MTSGDFMSDVRGTHRPRQATGVVHEGRIMEQEERPLEISRVKYRKLSEFSTVHSIKTSGAVPRRRGAELHGEARNSIAVGQDDVGGSGGFGREGKVVVNPFCRPWRKGVSERTDCLVGGMSE